MKAGSSAPGSILYSPTQRLQKLDFDLNHHKWPLFTHTSFLLGQRCTDTFKMASRTRIPLDEQINGIRAGRKKRNASTPGNIRSGPEIVCDLLPAAR
ncbi:hypothetical protein DNTS_004453 [Danionella cerebrum]|uniref:Uncharacterized protein n=1 Tax=Danionella cerebrum TaxID=2873325 RepID=A0A553PZH7_9TELE|nr:hypothetical protein DNTS_004453 [Danionella translucida]